MPNNSIDPAWVFGIFGWLGWLTDRLLQIISKKKISLSLSFENGELFILNSGKESLDLVSLTVELIDFSVKPKFAKKIPILCPLGFTIMPNDRKLLLRIDDNIVSAIEEINAVYDLGFKAAGQGLQPMLCSIIFHLHYTKLPGKLQKKKTFERYIYGRRNMGWRIEYSPYHFERHKPFWRKISLSSSLSVLLHPISFYKNRKNRKYTQLILDAFGIFICLDQKTLTTDKAKIEMENLIKKVPKNRHDNFLNAFGSTLKSLLNSRVD